MKQYRESITLGYEPIPTTTNYYTKVRSQLPPPPPPVVVVVVVEQKSKPLSNPVTETELAQESHNFAEYRHVSNFLT